jgi:hypothetical protein
MLVQETDQQRGLVEEQQPVFIDWRAIRIAICFVASIASGNACWAIGGIDSIDPDRASSQGVWRGDEIDPQSIRPSFQPSTSNDTGPLRMERYQWDRIDPGQLVAPNIAPYQVRSQELVVSTLPGNQNVLPSQVMGDFGPSTIDGNQPIAPDSAVLNPIDPGATEMRSLLFGRVDPGRIGNQLSGPAGGVGRSVIFDRQFESPAHPAGAPTRRARLGW